MGPISNEHSFEKPTEENNQTVSSVELQDPENLNTVGAFRTLCDLETTRLKIVCGDRKAVLNEEEVSLPHLGRLLGDCAPMHIIVIHLETSKTVNIICSLSFEPMDG